MTAGTKNRVSATTEADVASLNLKHKCNAATWRHLCFKVTLHHWTHWVHYEHDDDDDAGVYLRADEGVWPPLYQREHDRLHPTHDGVFVPLCVISVQTELAHRQSRYSPPDLSRVR